MKLHDIIPLHEDVTNPGMFVTYKVSAVNAPHVYYGIAEIPEHLDDTDEQDLVTITGIVKKSFLAGGLRKDEKSDARGAKQLVDEAGGVDRLEFDVMSVFPTFREAFGERNEYRSSDDASITGPSHWPIDVYNQSTDEEKSRWKRLPQLNKATARQAMGEEFADLCAYTYDDVKRLASTMDKVGQATLKLDLDKLRYPQFKAKYFPGK